MAADAGRRRLRVRHAHEGCAIHHSDARPTDQGGRFDRCAAHGGPRHQGDLYEYMLSKIATASQNGQFRTPRHIIQLMVELTQPTPKDVVCDPACGTAGFLVAVGEALRRHHPNLFHNRKLREHFHSELFHGFDFDSTMLRIGSMNLLLHGVEHPALHKVRWNEPLTKEDLAELERLFVESGIASTEVIRKTEDEEGGLGLFIRSLVGLDRAAAKQALSGFIDGKILSAPQLEFVNLVINHLTQCGWMRPEQLYESPFTDDFPEGPNSVFKEDAALSSLLSSLAAVRENAAGQPEARSHL